MPDNDPIPTVGVLNEVFQVLHDRARQNTVTHVKRKELESRAGSYTPRMIFLCLSQYYGDKLIAFWKTGKIIDANDPKTEYDEVTLTSDGTKNNAPYEAYGTGFRLKK